MDERAKETSDRPDERSGEEPDRDALEDGGDEAMPESKAGLRRKEAVIGGVFILTLAAALVGLNYLKGAPVFSGEYELIAHFDEVQGIQEGAPVTMAGVTVGRVTDLTLASGRQGVLVRLEIEDDHAIPRGSTASVGGLAALDNAKVSIERGPLDADRLEPGDTIPSEDGGGLTTMTEEVDTALRGATRTLQEMERLISETRGDLTATAGNLRAASEGAREFVAEERRDLDEAIATMNELGVRLTELSREMEGVADQGGDTLVATLSDVRRVTRRLDTTLVSLRASGDRLENILTAVDSGEGTMGRMVHDPSLYNRLDSLFTHIDGLVVELKEKPDKYLGALELFSLF